MCVYLNTKEVFIVIPDDYKPEEFERSPNQTCIGWMFMKNDRHQSFVVIKVIFSLLFLDSVSFRRKVESVTANEGIINVSSIIIDN